jgi:hypothetical protein
VIEALRRIAARSATPALDALASELEPLLPPRSRESQAQDAGVAVPLRMRAPEADGEWRLLTTLAHFGTTTNVTLAELTLEAFLPADERTARAPRVVCSKSARALGFVARLSRPCEAFDK